MAVVDLQLGDSLRLTPTEEILLASFAEAIDSVRLGEALASYYGAVVVEAINVRSRLLANQQGNVSLVDALQVVSRLYSAHNLVLGDTFGISQTDALQAAIVILEKLGLVSGLAANGNYQLTLTQAMRLSVSLGNFFGADILDELQMSELLFSNVLAIAEAEDAVGLEAAIAPQLLLNATCEEGLDVTAEMAIAMLFNPTVLEGIELSAGMLEPNGSFTTWAMNTRTGAVTEYADFTFNSFAALGNRYLGANEDGLFELQGDDDDGDPIIARIKGGFMQFGGTKLSRLKEAYIAVQGEGRFVLKIRTADDEIYNYGVDTRDGRSTKINMGKGQRSRYFAFELISSGQDFDLDTLEFVPIVMQRRA